MRSALRGLALTVALVSSAAPGGAPDEDWIPLFDGKTLAGWRAAESPASFSVVDGAIACDGPRGHLFYVGADGKAAFVNFEASFEVKARPGANSGVFFHTAFQERDWPATLYTLRLTSHASRLTS